MQRKSLVRGAIVLGSVVGIGLAGITVVVLTANIRRTHDINRQLAALPVPANCQHDTTNISEKTVSYSCRSITASVVYTMVHARLALSGYHQKLAGADVINYGYLRFEKPSKPEVTYVLSGTRQSKVDKGFGAGGTVILADEQVSRLKISLGN